MKNTDMEKLIYQTLSRQNAMMIDRILPHLERLEDNFVAMKRDHGLRLDQAESALGDLAAEMLRIKGDPPNPDVRPD